MGTKEKLLELLQENKGNYLSGEEIAQRLSISRTAVWKGVNALRQMGYAIHAAQNRGYSLDAQTDVLSESGIHRYLRHDASLRLKVLSSIGSTNALMRERANNAEPEGLVILANQQTKGRGRMGRDFYSPPDTGVYMSLLLRPESLLPQNAVRITTMAAVAACRAIEEITPKQAEIKWVNDIYLNGKKVCGILTEAAVGLETGSLEYVIMGIGLNVYPPDGGFPAELSEIADAILRNQTDDGKNRLSASFLNHFLDIYHSPNQTGYVQEYRCRSFLIGQPVTVTFPAGVRNGYAIDVDEECRLVVRFEDGSLEHLSSAEVSVRKVLL